MKGSYTNIYTQILDEVYEIDLWLGMKKKLTWHGILLEWGALDRFEELTLVK
jgi:hypothetical protein